MKKKWNRVIWIFVIILIVAFLAYPKLNFSKKENNQSTPKKQQSVNVRVIVVKPDLLREIIRSAGSLISDEEVDLAFETSGKLVKIFFSEGTQVAKGQLLAKLRDDDLQAQKGKLLIQLKLAQERESRQKALLEKEAVSQESYDQVKTELQSIEAEIHLLDARITHTEIHAPFDGIVGLRYVSEGAIVNTGTKIAKLVRNKPLKIDFTISERYAGLIKNGTPLNFKLEKVENIYSAKVYAVEPAIDPKTRTLAVRAIYPNTNEDLQPGRFVSVELVIREIQNAINVPTQCVIPELGAEKVFVVKNGKAESVQVITGLRTEEKVEITNGLNFGDTVVVSGIMQLRNGTNVNIEQTN